MTRLFTVLLIAGFLGSPAPGRAASCTSACTSARKACLRQARTDRSASRADCADLGGTKECMKSANSFVRSAKRNCRTALAECKSCCADGGAGATCATGCDGRPLGSTWAGVQRLFDQKGCTNQACHSSDAKQGGLDLTSNAYRNLVDAPSTLSALQRIRPGDGQRSLLYLKLAAATDPSQVPAGEIVGTPMPNGLAPLSAAELEAVRKWIYAGAPETGTVAGTAEALGACLPPSRPIRIRPLEVPARAEGFQFEMPPFSLKAHNEHEYCFAEYYDLTDIVPKQFQDPSGTLFLFNEQELRQDPQSHHLILRLAALSADQLSDPSFGAWTCQGGKKTGTPCEPTALGACGEGGHCISEIRESFACLGYGPPGGSFGPAIGGAQKAQAFSEFPAGVYAGIPMKGVLYWNPHIFNLTDRDTVIHAWLNYNYSNDTRWFVQGIFNVSQIFGANAAPFTRQTICNTHEVPRGAHVYSLSSHTHRHGEYFWIEGPDGTKLYENFVYNDPPNKVFDPPLVYDAEDPALRTLRYCAVFNNGVGADDQPDVNLVTRASRVPPNAPRFSQCRPTACVAGKVGAACNGPTDHATCDSTQGAGDGLCDACRITGGESTENEMFILIGSYYIPN